MKRIMTMISVLIVSFAIGACSFGKQETEKTEEIMADYYIGVEDQNAPYYSVDEDGKPMGIYVDLMDKVAEQGEFTYEFVETSPVLAQEELDAHNIDGFLGTFRKETGDKDETWTHSQSFLEAPLIIAVKNDAEISKEEALEDGVISAKSGSKEEQIAKKRAVFDGATEISFQTTALAVKDVEEGRSQAVILDENYYNHMDHTNWKTIALSKGVAVQHTFFGGSSDKLMTLFNESLHSMREDGSLETISGAK